MRHSLLLWLLAALILMGLPLTGFLLKGQSPQTLLELPPLTRHVAHAPFSWIAFTIIAALNFLMLAGIAILFLHHRGCVAKDALTARYAFPVWGWLGGMIMLVGWWLAWTRFNWFMPLQGHTFCLPWIGYILLVNAWCCQRSGTCLIQEAPGRFLLLFPVSASFWWFFEFLNRIIQNWYYIGVDDFNPMTYVLFASLAFSTVLPAVLSTLRLLLTLPLFTQRLASTIAIQLPSAYFPAVLLLLLSATSLVLLSRFSDYLYPMVWVAPLTVITVLQWLWKIPTIFRPLSHGDWRALIAAAAAALICGFFWEMWNYFSLARWSYSIPFVDRFHVFAMPALGYGGYLPFGLECLLVGTLVMERHQLGLGDNNQNGASAHETPLSY